MVTFLAGGTGTPKLLSGAVTHYEPGEVTVVANTGDDVVFGGMVVCPDIDTVLYERSGLLDRETWWGIAEDSTVVHDHLRSLVAATDLEETPGYLPPDAQTEGRPIGRWRRFTGAPPFMELGDHDRAIHHLRTTLIDQGNSLTDTTHVLADALDVEVTVLPMSDDPVASIIHTPDGPQHFQEYWVANRGTPPVDDVEFRGIDTAEPTDAVIDAIRSGPVVIGPSNPVTSIGPMRALPGIDTALDSTTVVAVSPFVEDEVFSGPADDLMEAIGYEASTAGVTDIYPFVDAFVLDTDDSTTVDRPVVHTDTTITTTEDAVRVVDACRDAIEAVTMEGHP